MNDQNQFYYIKKVGDNWLENIDVMEKIDNKFAEMLDELKKINEANDKFNPFKRNQNKEKEKKEMINTQIRKCTDFFRKNLINASAD
ncbi:MAG: hypothetical protein ACPLRN_02555, partial [Microgenomates group bacterium]